MWTDCQQTRIIQNRRGRKLYRWRVDKLDVKEKQQEFQRETKENFSELLENIGTTKNVIERDNARASIIEGWEPLVKTTASKVIGNKLIVCNRGCRDIWCVLRGLVWWSYAVVSLCLKFQDGWSLCFEFQDGFLGVWFSRRSRRARY